MDRMALAVNDRIHGTMMPVNEDPAEPEPIVLIDGFALHRASLIRFLEDRSRDDALAFNVVEAVASPEEVGAHPEARLVLFSTGGIPVTAPAIQEAIEKLSMAEHGSPVVVLSERTESACVVAALRAGAKGFIPATIDPVVMLRALRFIIGGGVFYPPEALLDTPRPEHDGRAGEAEDGHAAQSGPVSLTSRQVDVLQMLRRGQSNKQIAIELRMRESTVKVHVRQIMRKLGAANRTQVALCAQDLLPPRVVPGSIALTRGMSAAAMLDPHGMQPGMVSRRQMDAGALAASVLE